MQALFDHIDTVKQKPHHVRRQVAFTAAAVGAGLIGLMWLAVSLSTGVFAIENNSFADKGGEIETAGTVDSNSQLAGSAAALSDESDSTPRIEIVDTTPDGQSPQSEQTVIPF